jgi:two-component system phosphate regulon response regulator PhoB/two-component system alkaline phosphatase synthesis response regulator PhoP
MNERMNNEKKLVFMLVADEDDRVLTSSTLQELGHNVPIRFLSHSTELFAALKEQTPSIILIDYNIAPEPGVEILKQLKSDERYSSIPIVILTDSPLWHYHAQCYSHGASTVIKKPDTGKMTTHKIRTFFDYWVDVAETYSQ